MKPLMRISLVLAICLFGSTAFADAPLIFCEGSGCGGSGPGTYAYPIDSGSYPMMDFRVGTNDLNPDHYTNTLIPRGWSFAVEERPMSHAEGVHTPHGDVSPGPCWCQTAGSVHWWTDDATLAVEFFTFGYDHPWKPEDVGWNLLTRREGPPISYYEFQPFWDAGVGTGMGPVHAPFEAPDFTLELDASYSGGTLSLNFALGTPKPATWMNFLILTSPTPRVIPLWSVDLPIIQPPLHIPITFPFPAMGTIGIFSGLFTEGAVHAYVLEWVETGDVPLDFTGTYLFTLAYEDGTVDGGTLTLVQEGQTVHAQMEMPHLTGQALSGSGTVDGDLISFEVFDSATDAPEPTSLTFNGRGIDLSGDGMVEVLTGSFDGTECTDTCDEVVGDFDAALPGIPVPEA